MTETVLLDKAEREMALDISRSFCVQAPAGSGKTELLIQRFLKLLIQSEEPEDILAFTFTRKAAFEMRQRLLTSLRQENSDKLTKPTQALVKQVLERNIEREWHLLDNPQRLQIKTIDAFNSSICAQLPIVSGLGGQVDIVEDMESIYQQAIESSLAKINTQTKRSINIERFLVHLDNNLAQAKNLLISLLYKRDQWLSLILRFQHEDLRKELSLNLRQVIVESLESAHISLSAFGHEIISLLNFAANNLTKRGDYSLEELKVYQKLPNAQLQNIAAWESLARFFLTQDQRFRKTVNISNGFPKADDGENAEEKSLFKNKKTEYLSLISKLKEIPDTLSNLQNILVLPALDYSDEEWSFLEALTQVLLDVVSELTLLLNQNNQADYIHVSASALQALSHEDSLSDLSLRLDYRIKHILVDEFQDTSLQQIELLKRLTSGWQSNDGRTLFIVGDGMQSCYSFRNADVGLFLKARDEGIGEVKLNSLQLKMNFRSTTAIVDWVNHVFTQSFPQQDNISRGAVTYSSSQAIKVSDNSGVSTSLLLDDANSDTKKDLSLARSAEARLLIEQLKPLLLKPNVSIAILVRNRSHLNAIIPLLRQENINWNASEIDPLSAFPVVTDLLSLLRALTNLADKTALLALLRTPFVGLSLNDIHQIAIYADKNELSLWQSLKHFGEQKNLSADAQERLSRVVPILMQARKQRQMFSIRNWLEQSWIHLGGPASLQSNYELQYIERFFLLLETESINGEIDNIHSFERKCDKTYLGTTHDATRPLQIMTIHKAKGLEFDYVLIPGLDRAPRSSDKELFLWHEHNSATTDGKLLLAPLNALGESNNPTYQYLKNEAALRTRLENTRLLYIAITRAKQKAFLFAKVQVDNSSNIKMPTRNSLFATVWPALSQSPELYKTIHLNQQAQTPTNETHENLVTRRLKHSWKSSQQTIFSSRYGRVRTADKPHLNLIEKKVGELIHECLRLIVTKQIDIFAKKKLNTYETFWRSSLKPVCFNNQSMEYAIQLIKNNLESCLKHKKADWLFDNSHQDSSCEFPVSDYRQQWRKEHIIDRTFIDEGVRWIIDYKSSSLSQNDTQADFLKKQEDHYLPQLSRYAELFQRMDDRPVKTALFFTSLPYFHEITL
jgi:ATP-dependent helicase/nuclease subunit A